MSLDPRGVAKIAHLARIKVPEEDLPALVGDLNAMLGFFEQLDEVDITGVEPMTSAVRVELRWREDVVTDGAMATTVLRNAPDQTADFFAVPKVVE
jgi:aspartyl-tRNA(Asn)/glutamyl-tRNA(Gln) amidotransferase subunit C